MDQVYVVVVKETGVGVDVPFTPRDSDLQFPMRAKAGGKFRVAVWRGVQSAPKRGVNRDKMLGIVAMLGISVASWAGLAALISHLVH